MSDDLNEKLAVIRRNEADVFVVSVPVRDAKGEILTKEAVVQFFDSIPTELRSKIIFFSPTDDPVSPYFDVLPKVRLFVTQFTFTDESNYDKSFAGGSAFADAIAEIYGIEITPENEYHPELFNSFAPSDQRRKITTCWNFSYWRRILKMFQEQGGKCLSGGARDIDINCRFNPYSGWNNKHRESVVTEIESIDKKYVTALSTGKIPVNEYFSEIERSKILVSPFGWGAICPKDYEAIMKGCLLVKPDIGHINIFPNVLIPNVTYVPVKWDLSDLKEKLEYYLENEDERNTIVKKAANVFEQSMRAEVFVGKVKEMFEAFDNSYV